MICTFHKDHPEKISATSLPIDSAPPIAKLSAKSLTKTLKKNDINQPNHYQNDREVDITLFNPVVCLHASTNQKLSSNGGKQFSSTLQLFYRSCFLLYIQQLQIMGKGFVLLSFSSFIFHLSLFHLPFYNLWQQFSYMFSYHGQAHHIPDEPPWVISWG